MASSVALTADAVGQVITFVAPGFLARVGYRLRFPGADRPAGEVLIISVVTSLPFVALAGALPGQQRPTQFGYVAALLLVSLIAGYGYARLRDTPLAKRMLVRLDYHVQPEGSIYAQTLAKMSDTGTVLVELKDGRRVWGCPRNGPQTKDDGVTELYLVYPEAEGERGEWFPVGAGLIVPLTEVSTIVLSEEPTRAPQEPEATPERVEAVPGEPVPARR